MPGRFLQFIFFREQELFGCKDGILLCRPLKADPNRFPKLRPIHHRSSGCACSFLFAISPKPFTVRYLYSVGAQSLALIASQAALAPVLSQCGDPLPCREDETQWPDEQAGPPQMVLVSVLWCFAHTNGIGLLQPIHPQNGMLSTCPEANRFVPATSVSSKKVFGGSHEDPCFFVMQG